MSLSTERTGSTPEFSSQEIIKQLANSEPYLGLNPALIEIATVVATKVAEAYPLDLPEMGANLDALAGRNSFARYELLTYGRVMDGVHRVEEILDGGQKPVESRPTRLDFAALETEAINKAASRKVNIDLTQKRVENMNHVAVKTATINQMSRLLIAVRAARIGFAHAVGCQPGQEAETMRRPDVILGTRLVIDAVRAAKASKKN